jgi:hypothetical protein
LKSVLILVLIFRTNVIESLIALKLLDIQWQVLRIPDIRPEFLSQRIMSTIWADNGDALSRIYTGTGALKSGFTRTGKRTFTGKVCSTLSFAFFFH